MSDDLREPLADVSHDIWSSWMRWMFTVGTFNADGTWTMPADKVERWLWQMNTPYALLTEGEKDSDREQADKILASSNRPRRSPEPKSQPIPNHNRTDKESNMEGLTEGRIVHFVMNDGGHRPAIVVRVWSKESGVSNLQVFTDGSNDVRPNDESESMNAAIKNGMLWRTSIPYSEEPMPNTWHWIEKA